MKWGKRRSAQFRKANREYQRRWRRRKPKLHRSITLRFYYRHRAAELTKRRLVREANQRVINAAKCRPCQDCHHRFPPYVMDFDHVRSVKQFQIGGSMHLSRKRILREIAKCDIVCSNCHRVRTFCRGPKVA